MGFTLAKSGKNIDCIGSGTLGNLWRRNRKIVVPLVQKTKRIETHSPDDNPIQDRVSYIIGVQQDYPKERSVQYREYDK